MSILIVRPKSNVGEDEMYNLLKCFDQYLDEFSQHLLKDLLLHTETVAQNKVARDFANLAYLTLQQPGFSRNRLLRNSDPCYGSLFLIDKPEKGLQQLDHTLAHKTRPPFLKSILVV